MPTYEYECQSCHQRVEAVQKFSDPDLTVCANCGGELRKVFSAVGIVFKGSGFYKNDSRSSHGASKTASAESGSGSEAAAPATPSEAAKPAAGDSAAAPKSPAPATPATTPAKPSSGSTSSSAAAAS